VCHSFRGFLTDAFFGASPVVASAFDVRLGATPRGRFDSYTHLQLARGKGDYLLSSSSIFRSRNEPEARE
jgi:hypothetical protein